MTTISVFQFDLASMARTVGRAGVAPCDPFAPGFVHVVEIGHSGQEEFCPRDVGLVGRRPLQQVVNGREYLFGLTRRQSGSLEERGQRKGVKDNFMRPPELVNCP